MQERTREEQEAMMDEQRDREENWRLVKDIHLKVCQLFALQQKEFEPIKVQELKREILTQLEKLSGQKSIETTQLTKICPEIRQAQPKEEPTTNEGKIRAGGD